MKVFGTCSSESLNLDSLSNSVQIGVWKEILFYTLKNISLKISFQPNDAE